MVFCYVGLTDYERSALSGYGRGEAMQAMHKGVYRGYASAPHDV